MCTRALLARCFFQSTSLVAGSGLRYFLFALIFSDHCNDDLHTPGTNPPSPWGLSLRHGASQTYRRLSDTSA